MSYAETLMEKAPEVTRQILKGNEEQLRWLLQWAYDQGVGDGSVKATNIYLDGFREGRDRNIKQGAGNE